MASQHAMEIEGTEKKVLEAKPNLDQMVGHVKNCLSSVSFLIDGFHYRLSSSNNKGKH